MSDARKAQLYLVLVFVVGWSLCGLVALAGGLENKVAFSWLATLLHFVPAACALVLRLWITREGFGDAGVRVGRPRLYLLAYFLPIFAIAGSYTLAVSLGAGYLTLDPGQVGAKGPLPQGSATILIVSAFLLDPMVLALLAFGEEYGWRGYLLPKLLPLGLIPALLLQGVLWGLWQLPLVWIASESVAQFYTSMGLVLLFATAAGSVWGILFLASGSIWIPTLASAVRESMVSLFGLLFVARAVNYREISGMTEIAVWALVALLFLMPLPVFRAASQRS